MFYISYSTYLMQSETNKIKRKVKFIYALCTFYLHQWKYLKITILFTQYSYVNPARKYFIISTPLVYLYQFYTSATEAEIPFATSFHLQELPKTCLQLWLHTT